MWYDSLRFGIDWLNVTVDCASVSEFIEKVSSACDLDIDSWVMLDGGLRFYPNTLSYSLAGYAAITVSFHLLEDGTVPIDTTVVNNHGLSVSISGDGCRYLDTHCEGGLRKFALICREYPHNATRVDTCMDILDKDNPIVPLFCEFALVGHNPGKGDLAIKANINRTHDYFKWYPVWDTDFQCDTNNVYIGKRTSIAQCNVYNKKVEVRTRTPQIADQILESVGCTDYWYRVEYRAYSRKLANACFESVCDNTALETFFYMADNFFTFVELEYDLKHIDMSHQNVVWFDFVEWLRGQQKAHFVQLTTVPYVPSSVPRLVSWMKRNAAFLVSIEKIAEVMPEFYNQVVFDVGVERRRRTSRYKQFDNEITVLLNDQKVSGLVI